jgi:hypothetical protein
VYTMTEKSFDNKILLKIDGIDDTLYCYQVLYNFAAFLVHNFLVTKMKIY